MDVFAAHYSPPSQYLEQWSAGLREEGLDVVLGTGRLSATIRTFLREGLPEVIHIHWLAAFLVSDSRVATLLKSVATVVGLVLAKAMGVNVVWTVHDQYEHRRRHPEIERSVKRALVRYVFDAVITHTDASRDRIVRTYNLDGEAEERFHVVPHGHYLNRYEDDIGRDEARDKLGIDRDAFVYGYFGLVRPYKQVPELIRAFGERDRDDERLLVVGNAYIESLQREVEDLSRKTSGTHSVLEFVPDDAVQRYLRAMDVLVLPYRDITTSGTAILGMCFGRPVIAPGIGCLPEVLAEQQQLLYPLHGPAGLQAALDNARDADLEAIGERNRERVARNGWGGIAEETVSIYNSLV